MIHLTDIQPWREQRVGVQSMLHLGLIVCNIQTWPNGFNGAKSKTKVKVAVWLSVAFLLRKGPGPGQGMQHHLSVGPRGHAPFIRSLLGHMAVAGHVAASRPLGKSCWLDASCVFVWIAEDGSGQRIFQ